MSTFRPTVLPAATANRGVSHLIDAAFEHGAVVLRRCDLDPAWFTEAAWSDPRVRPRSHLSASPSGPPDFREQLSTRDVDHIIRGPKPLPIHTDGLLSGTQVDIILLYAKEAEPCRGGQTVIVGQNAALEQMPTALREPIENSQFEYRVRDHDYFQNRTDSWYRIPCWRDFGRRPSLNLALPFSGRFVVLMPSWEVKLAHSPNARTGAYFRDLESHLLDERWSYCHDWRPGDLLVLDNQATLHGRLPFVPGDRRVLWRLQFVLMNRPS